eukprot:gene20083-biopygen11567
MILHASAWGKRQRTRTGRGPDAGRTLEFEQTDADRTRAWPFLPVRVRVRVRARVRSGGLGPDVGRHAGNL